MSELKHHSNAIKKVELINEVVDWILKGSSYSDIVEKLESEYSLVQYAAVDMYSNAKKKIVEDTAMEIDQIIHTHTSMYEHIYQYFDEVDFHPGRLKAMKAKEALLGLHKEENIVEINNTLNVETEQESEYDLNKLTIEEQIQLSKYLVKIQ